MPSDQPRDAVSPIEDRFTDLYGAEGAAARLTARLERLEPGAARRADDGRILLSPPFAQDRDRVDGPGSARAMLVVFGAHGTASSRPLGRVLTAVRERDISGFGVAWRHFPDRDADGPSAMLALAVEAAASRGRFWVLTHELLRLRHFDSVHLHAALIQAGLDPEQLAETIRTGAGGDRIVEDVESALASGVVSAQTLFINGERYMGELQPDAVVAALESA